MSKKIDSANKNFQPNTALYTKYRPQKFDQVLGQEHVINVLRDSLKNGNIAHAYLFSGSRGTGKTSVARILAHEIGTSQNDLFEIDAASNNGVDEIRALNESVNTLPFNSKYKVYILDEVHMLSKSAFNAFLKTLEEPPSHVIFILATTEVDKIPETILSRCEVHYFKTPNREILRKMIDDTAENEGYRLETGVAELIALLGDGSFRDSHTILQKIINSSLDKKIELKEVEKVTGSPKFKLINDLLEALTFTEIEKIFKVTKNIAEDNLDIKVFIQLFLEKFRAGIVLKIVPAKEKDLKDFFSEDDLLFIKGLIKEKPEFFNAKNLLKILESYSIILKSAMPVMVFEMVLVDMINFKS